MPKKMQIIPIQCESLGTRSLATLVETPDVKILLDPGCALGIRYKLMPHPIEYELVRKITEEICFELASKVDAIFISHYHFDHLIGSFTHFALRWHTPELAESLYKDKLIYSKHPRSNINLSQRKRGHRFEKFVAPLAKQLNWCDDLSFSFGDTTIQFSPPVWHGEENTGLGYVVQCCIKYNDMTFVFAPDSQCLNQSAINWILSQNPDLLLIGGPPIYLKGFRIKIETLDIAKNNLFRLVQTIPRILVDHHLLRSLEWSDWLQEIVVAAEQMNHICECVASYKNTEMRLLEAQRELLYKQDPPDRDFMRWTKLAKTIRAESPPPIAPS